jgi:hypothetical protein
MRVGGEVIPLAIDCLMRYLPEELEKYRQVTVSKKYLKIDEK